MAGREAGERLEGVPREGEVGREVGREVGALAVDLTPGSLCFFFLGKGDGSGVTSGSVFSH